MNNLEGSFFFLKKKVILGFLNSMSITEGRTDTPGIFYLFLLTSKPIFKMKSLVDAQ